MAMSLMKTPPDCPDCGRPAVFQPISAHLYSGQDWGPVYECVPCNAWVGCHKNGKQPLGIPANQATRELRKRAHAVFDPLWAAKMHRDGCGKSAARSAAYKWLAGHLGIPARECHISWMTDDHLKQIIRLCTRPDLWRKPSEEPHAGPETALS